jgi:tetratricopeptide (TPR) repeat protein
MKVRRRGLSLIWIIITAFFSAGCSSFDTMVRSVENTFTKKQSEFDAAMLDEARMAYQSGDIILAEERYKEYIGKNQRSGDKASLAVAHAQLGRIAFEKRDFKASHRHFEEAIKLDPDNLEARGQYGESLYRQKDYNRAQTVFQLALQDAPNDSRFQVMLGLTLAQQKQYQVGLRYLKQALGEQGAYEEIAHIYNSHYEFEKATLAMSKARESYSKQQQLAARSPGGISTPRHAGQQETARPHATQFPASQARLYHPAQTAVLPQQQPNDIQQIGRQGQHAVPQQMPMPQQQFVTQQPMQHHAVQQPTQPYPQQPAMMPNIPYSYQHPYRSQQNDNTNYGVMNSPVQPGQNPAISQPQQIQQPQPQGVQDHRPPQGFAAMGQHPPAAPTQETQTIFAPLQHHDRWEIAYHPNDSDAQPDIMQPGTMYSMTSSPINPLVERATTAEQPATTSSPHSTMPMTGNQNSQAYFPTFFGHSSL